MEYFDHIDAGSIEEAVRLLKKRKGVSKLIAGGTDLLGVLKERILTDYPERLINIKTIPGLDTITEDNEEIKIGPLVRLSKIAENTLIRAKFPVLAEAATSVATPEIRNVATIGGNLCQDVRCWYYRYPRQIGGPIICRRKERKSPCLAITGDNRYHAIMAIEKCIAVCPSDTAIALAALNAKLVITGHGSSREIPVSEFYKALNNDLKTGEIVTGIRIPKNAGGGRQNFIKYTLREPVDFAIVSIACVKHFNGDTVSSASIYLGGIAAGPFRAVKAEEAVTGKHMDESKAQQAADIQMAGVKPLSNNGYKIEIARSLIKQALLG